MKLIVNTEPDMAQALRTARTIAVVGLSPKPHRESFNVARYLQAAGYRILPVNPIVAASDEPTILGEPCYANLQSAAQSLPAGQRIDVVNVFRNSEDVPPVAQEAVEVGARALWLQLGIENEDAAALALAHGLLVWQDCCIKIERRRIFG